MTPQPRERIPSCRGCRERHVRCNKEIPCQNCKKADRACENAGKGFRFQKSTRVKSRGEFSADQPWMSFDKIDNLSYVDVTDQLAASTRSRSQNPPRTDSATSPEEDDEVDGGDEADGIQSASRNDDELGVGNPTSNLEFNSPLGPPVSIYADGRQPDYAVSSSPSGIAHQVSPHALSESALSFRRTQHLSFSFLSPTPYGADIPQSSPRVTTVAVSSPYTSYDALHGIPEGGSDKGYLNLLEACLMRNFRQNLAHMFDTTDRDRHFTDMVPQRAIFCPVLLYAIYTASARHLVRVSQKDDPSKIVEFDGIQLPGLDESTAIRYHNVAIQQLIAISSDTSQSYNEDALTAATILRFYEQIDTPLTGADAETYHHTVLAIVNTQQDESFYAVRTIHGPVRDNDYYAVPAISLRHSACLIALRQEISAVLLYRRPFRLPLCPNNEYTGLDQADDFTWSNRIIVWTADVLKFCFGTTRVASNHSDRQKYWDNLKVFEDTWEQMRPVSFKATYHRDADPKAGRPFPEYWHLNPCQILGLQHLEVGQTLLAIYDPRMPRIGLGASVMQRNVEARIRKATLVLCGLASSNPRCIAAMTGAAVGISMFGEYFSDPGEQEALVALMETLEKDHAWPTQAAVMALKDAWSQQTPRPVL